MLKLSDFRFAAVAGTMLLFAPAGAEATVYNYDFTSTDGLLNAEGAFTVTGDEITGVTGALSGLVTQTINAIAPSTAPYGYSTSPDGAFYYDNVLSVATNPFLDIGGVLFTTTQNPGGYWNLWGNSSGNYSLFESAPGLGYPIQEIGNLTVSAVAEPSTWAMMLLGFGGLGFVGYRASRRGAVAA
ncbi:MAG: PEP-CTERM sorting domain-containing protein [Roseiarcus sp.]|uniref:PEP-CTERM sorting domain-containing protein n=1 Tax=Roseiarcus sp. TaxID=1969460 RepID=UPI003C2974FD